MPRPALRRRRANVLPCHVLRLALGLLLPSEEHLGVAVSNVLRMIDIELGGRGIDPVMGTFDFGNIANGRFVEDHVAGSVAPLSTKLLIAEGRYQANRPKHLC